MILSYKYRMYPNSSQECKLLETLEGCRFLYNAMLDRLNHADKDEHLSEYDMNNMLPQMKREHPFLQDIHSKVLQMVNRKLWSNIRSLSQLKKNGHKIGGLRYKGKGWYKTFRYNQSGFSYDVKDNRINLSKIGSIKCKFHRKPRGNIKGVTVKRTTTDKWFAILQCDVEPHVSDEGNDEVVGIDLGISKFVADSDGLLIENPKFIKKTMEKIKKYQRLLHRKKKGSNNYRKCRIKLVKVYEKLYNQRNDFLHKLSRYYVDNYAKIYTEKLDIKNMIGKYKSLNMYINDAVWGRFLSMLSYKAESAGKMYMEIDTLKVKPSQRCPCCNHLEKKLLSERVHDCQQCGFKTDRDHASALTIRKSGEGRARLSVENEPLLRKVSYTDVIEGQVRSAKQEAPSAR